jgi:hypothetical protein
LLLLLLLVKWLGRGARGSRKGGEPGNGSGSSGGKRLTTTVLGTILAKLPLKPRGNGPPASPKLSRKPSRRRCPG